MPSLEAAEHPTEVPVTRRALPASRALIAVVTLAIVALAGRADAFERARAELEAVGLGARLSHYPGQLSGGEQQRVALARALAPDPAILVADEPTGNLDEATGATIVDLMFRLKAERGATLVLVTHDEGLAKRCDRSIRLRYGKIVDEATR